MSSTYPVSSADSPATTLSRSNRRCAVGRLASRALAIRASTFFSRASSGPGHRSGRSGRTGTGSGARAAPRAASATLCAAMAKTKAPNGQPGPAVTDDGGPELAQQRLDGVLPGFQAARVQPVLVVVVALV